MLHPPVALSGIPAMRKLAKEISTWQNRASFEHLVTYATTPPELPATFEKSDGMRSWKAQVLRQLGENMEMKIGSRSLVRSTNWAARFASFAKQFCNKISERLKIIPCCCQD